MKLKKLCSAVVACAVLMTGCSATTTEESKNDIQNTSGKYPIKIQHAYGETVIESEPKNIATISWGNHDVPLALGVVPVGVSKANYGKSDENGLLPWTAQKYKELGVEKPVVYDDIDGLDYSEYINVLQALEEDRDFYKTKTGRLLNLRDLGISNFFNIINNLIYN